MRCNYLQLQIILYLALTYAITKSHSPNLFLPHSCTLTSLALPLLRIAPISAETAEAQPVPSGSQIACAHKLNAAGAMTRPWAISYMSRRNCPTAPAQTTALTLCQTSSVNVSPTIGATGRGSSAGNGIGSTASRTRTLGRATAEISPGVILTI
jgi:hypothetical protein